MARLSPLSAALLLACCCAGAFAAIPITKVPIDMQVSISGYEVKGKQVPSNGVCMGTHFGEPCLQVVHADEDAVTFQYVLNATIAGGPAVSSTAYLCYSPWSQIGRPWRATSAAKDFLSDKSCPPAHAKKMLPAPTTTPQTMSFIPAAEYPSSTVYVRVVALCKNATSTSPTTATYPCARGRSVGYFQIQRIKSRTAAVEGACAAVIVGGLLLVTGAVFLDNWMTKHHKRP